MGMQMCLRVEALSAKGVVVKEPLKQKLTPMCSSSFVLKAAQLLTDAPVRRFGYVYPLVNGQEVKTHGGSLDGVSCELQCFLTGGNLTY